MIDPIPENTDQPPVSSIVVALDAGPRRIVGLEEIAYLRARINKIAVSV